MKKKEPKVRKPIKSVLLKSIGAFFKSFQIVTIPMAFIYLGILILMLLTFQGLFRSISNFAVGSVKAIAEMGGDVSINVKDFFNNVISNSNGDFFNGLSKSFNGFIANIQGATADLVDKLQKIAAESMRLFLTDFVVGFVVVVLLSIVGSVLTGIAIRKANGVKNNPGRFFLRTLLKTLVFASFLALGIWLGSLAAWTIPLVILVYLSFSSYYLLIQGYLMNIERKNAFKQIKFKFYMKFLGINAILYLMSFALGALIFLVVKNGIIAMFLVLPFIVYTNKFLDAYAEIFIINQFQKPQEIAQENIAA